MEDLLKWVTAQAESCKARMDAHEAIVNEERTKIATVRPGDWDVTRLASNAQGLQREGDAYTVWLTVLHEVARRVEAANRPC